jgi:chloramphenicol-sensitive protein RarD
VVANRVVWSLILLAVIITISRTWRRLRSDFTSRGVAMWLGIGSVFLAINWGLYVWAVENGLVIQASLGYMINPLVSVLLGVVVLKERLRSAQWIAIAIALVAVAVLTVGFGHPPWVGLILAVSFALYGFIKKRVGVGSVESLTIETAILAPIALAIMAGFMLTQHSAVETDGPRGVLLLVLLGPITAIPLLLFGGAANRVPLSSLGLMQYLTPLSQFLIGYFVFGEAMSSTRWVGFVLIWIALMVFTVDVLRSARKSASGPSKPEDLATSLSVTEPD